MIGQVYRVTLKQEIFQQQVENVLHFKSGVINDSEQHMAEAFDAFLTASWSLVQGNAVKYTGIRAQKVDPASDIVADILPTTTVGRHGGRIAPLQLSVILSLRSNTTSRRKNGRLFIAGSADADIDGEGKIDVSVRNEFATLGAALMSAFPDSFIGGDYVFGVYSPARAATQTQNAREPIFTPVKLIKVPAIYGIQRRRAQGVGA